MYLPEPSPPISPPDVTIRPYLPGKGPEVEVRIDGPTVRVDTDTGRCVFYGTSYRPGPGYDLPDMVRDVIGFAAYYAYTPDADVYVDAEWWDRHHDAVSCEYETWLEEGDA